MIYRWTTDFSRDKQAVLRPEQPKKRHPVTVIRLTSTAGKTCRIEYQQRQGTYKSAVQTPYDSTAAAYAVVRYLRHCPDLRDKLIFEAVKLGLQSQKAKPIRHTVITKAAFLQLPGTSARIDLTVSAGVITVRKVVIE